jgi:hypothetical protein
VILPAAWAGALLALLAAGPATVSKSAAPETLSAPAEAFLDTLSERSFHYFWDLSDSLTGLTPDRAPTPSFVSVGAVGFALTAYAIGAEHNWVTRQAAANRVRNTLRFFWEAPQDSSAHATGYHGFFYHFLDAKTGRRFETVELSTMDTALLMAGALFCGSYFDLPHDTLEAEIRLLADHLYTRVDWRWFQTRPPLIALAWSPEHGFEPYDWRGYNEAMLLHVLALGSPSYPVTGDVWKEWVKGYRWGTFQGQPHLGFAPMFGHQYTHVWIDFRGVRDAYMRDKHSDYFENSRRATLAQRAYAIANPGGFRGYGANLWGLSACDGPLDATVEVDGRSRTFRTYAARGASFTEIVDDGTLAPTALGGSIPFAPRQTVAGLMAIRRAYGPSAFSTYGFVDALNPTLDRDMKTQHGRVVAGVGWFDTDYLGIDEGPIVAMIENYRTGLVWRYMRTNRHVIRGLRRAGFTGGWLDEAAKSK